jgi:TRAP transporter TAXI family solute receptor
MGEGLSSAVLDCRAMNAKKVVCAAAVIGLTTMACGPSDERAALPGSRQFLSLGTAPPGGAFFVVGGALSEVLQANPGSIPWQVTAEATKGTQENIRRLVAGDLDLALANAAITYFAVRGEGKWESPQDVRVVMTLAPNVAMFLAPANSDVEGLGDLAGRRVVVGPAGAGFEYFVGPILEAHGVRYEDFTPLYNTQAGAVDMLADGSAEAAFLGGAIPTASITQATSSQDIRFVPFDEMAMQELISQYPFFDRVTVPAKTYRGQEEPFFGMNVGSMQLLTSAAADEDLIYEVTRVLWENRSSVVEKHAAGRAIQPEVVVRDTGVEFHPGAERYYREIGIWPQGSGD